MSDRRSLVARIAPAALIVAMAAAILLDGGEIPSAPPSTPADRMAGVMEGLPDDATVLVGFDPDVGTYAEIRPTVRAVIDALLARDMELIFVSLTPEGRALGLVEIARIGRGSAAGSVVDLGFVPGAEAGLISLTRSPGAAIGLLGPLPDQIDPALLGLALVIGGNDLGPRSWVEQLAPRVPELGLAAIAPAILLPELQPLAASGQLDALVATPGDGADLRAQLPAAADGADAGPSRLALLLGMLAAIGVLATSVLAGLADRVRSTRPAGSP